MNLFAAIADMEHGLLMYRIGELEMLTIGAIVLELKNLPKIFRLVQKIDRIAVVFSRLDTNGYRDRRQTHSRLGMKSFDLDRESAAIEWLEA